MNTNNMENSLDNSLDNPVLFIDMSYYIFHRFYALKSWYKRSQEDELDVENVLENKLFMEKFHKLFIENIKKIKKKNIKLIML